MLFIWNNASALTVISSLATRSGTLPAGYLTGDIPGTSAFPFAFVPLVTAAASASSDLVGGRSTAVCLV